MKIVSTILRGYEKTFKKVDQWLNGEEKVYSRPGLLVRIGLIILFTLIALGFMGLFAKSHQRDYVCENWSSYRLYRILDNTKLFEDLAEIYGDLCVGGSSSSYDLETQ